MVGVELDVSGVSNLFRAITILAPICPGDLTGSDDPDDWGYGVPDGILDAAEFFFYLDLFAMSCE